MEKKKAFLINIAYYGFFAVLAILAGIYVLPVLMPFVIGLIFAVLVQRTAERISVRTGCRKKMAAVLILAAVYLLVFSLVILCGGQAASAVGSFLMRLPSLYQTEILPFLDTVLEQIGNGLSDTDPFLAAEIESGLRQFVQNIGQTLTSASVNLLGSLSGYIAGIPSAVIRIIITGVSSFYIGADYDRIRDTVKKHLPARGRKLCGNIKEHGLNLLKVYIRSYCLLFLLTFGELTVGLLILGIPYAPLIGNYPLAAGLLILYVVITIVRNTVEPKIVGKQIGLHPLATLIAMFTGLSLWGLPGLFLLPIALMILVNMEKNGAIHLLRRETEDSAKTEGSAQTEDSAQTGEERN